jgi:hypothetical protein
MNGDDKLTLHGPAFRNWNPNNLERLRGALLGFDFAGQYFEARPYKPFRPRGLLIWGAPPLAVIDFAQIDSQEQVKAGYSGVPARFFSTGESFEQIAKQLDEGKEPPCWVSWEAINPTGSCRVFVRDPLGVALGPAQGIELVFWGLALER